MHLRYPEGFRSTIDAALTLRGNAVAARARRQRDRSATASTTKRFEPNVDIFSLASGGGALPVASSDTATLPVRFDIKIQAPGTLRLENNLARIVSRADLTLNGTYDTPVIFGRADIERGEIFFEGNRYRITRGTIDFLNPTRIQPFFDIEAETRIRVARPIRGQLDGERRARPIASPSRVSGTLDGRMNFEVNSDPPLPAVDIISLMFGQTSAADLANPELRRLRPDAATQSEEQLLKAGLLRVLTGGMTGSVSRAVEQSLGIDTVQITPSLGTERRGSADADGAADRRQAALEPRLPDLLARARHDDPRRPGDHPGVRPVGPPRLRVHAERRPHVRDRFPRAEDLLACCERWSSGARVLVLLLRCSPVRWRAAPAARRPRPSSIVRSSSVAIEIEGRRVDRSGAARRDPDADRRAAEDGRRPRDDHAPLQSRPLRGRPGRGRERRPTAAWRCATSCRRSTP